MAVRRILLLLIVACAPMIVNCAKYIKTFDINLHSSNDQPIVKPSFIVPNHNYCSLRGHSNRCTLYFDNTLLITCADEWFYLSRLDALLDGSKCIY